MLIDGCLPALKTMFIRQSVTQIVNNDMAYGMVLFSMIEIFYNKNIES